MKILISGFEPFTDNKINPTMYLVNALCEQSFKFQVYGVILPVSYSKSYQTLEAEINKYEPDIVISFGLAEKRVSINFEQFAKNIMDTKVPDNEGVVHQNVAIDPEDKESLTTNLQIIEINEILRNKNLFTELSTSAGTYVCNQLMYKTLQLSYKSGFKTGFIHIPSFNYLNKDELLKYGKAILNAAYEINYI